MRDRLFKLLFPRQYELIQRMNGLFKLSRSPDFALSTPEGTYLKDVHIYLMTDAQDDLSLKCMWFEVPYSLAPAVVNEEE